MILSSLKPPLSFPSVSGAVCTFNSQYAGLPLKAHEVAIDYTGSAISNVKIYSRGKNLIKEEISILNRYILANGTTGYNGTWGIVNVPIKGGLYYTISGINFPDTGTYFVWYDKNNTVISVIGNHKNYSNILAPSNAYYLGMSFLMSNSNPRYDLNTAQVEIGASATPYKTFVGNSYNITFTTPIYGGQYDCLTGIVTSNKDSSGGDISPTYQQTATANCLTSLGENNIFADTGDTTLRYIKLG